MQWQYDITQVRQSEEENKQHLNSMGTSGWELVVYVNGKFFWKKPV